MNPFPEPKVHALNCHPTKLARSSNESTKYLSLGLVTEVGEIPEHPTETGVWVAVGVKGADERRLVSHNYASPSPLAANENCI